MSTSVVSGPIFQLGIVVPDIEAAEQEYGRFFGVDDWLIMPDVEFTEGCEFRGGPSDHVAHIGLAYAGDLQLELIQPVRGTSIYTEFLDAGRTGLHHTAYLTDDFDATLARAGEAGLAVDQKGSMAGGLMSFAYIDGGATGSYVEVMHLTDDMRAMFDDLAGKVGGRNPWNR